MKRALLVIDVQNEFFSGSLRVTYPENSFENIRATMDVARENEIPIIVIQHTARFGSDFKKGTEKWALHERIKSFPYDHYIEKRYPGAFTGTSLEDLLKELEIETIAITGYMTNMCCDTTSRQAYHLNYKVEFLADATGTFDHKNKAGFISAKDLHEAALITQQTQFSQVLTLAEWKKKIAE
ncbi:cysteine hydrolase [Hazenella sp. IB182357]|uniref:Cysteine hydrolase n=1 Tax=Polycladospora coralii TaxID=2771432 RepID=A0A926NGD3_9BACL|nr:cysteine hydrolase family protein [Polycladospora coralii]MBD1373089.1 cysteine hydrolase [Polycladospora coralii]MBS7529565.1 cysteine hydrolase [Polycladospora coralii]